MQDPQLNFDLAVFYTSVQPYFYSYLQVVHGTSITAAGHITQTFSFTATVTSIVIGFVIKYTHHYKYFIILGASIYLIGVGVMIRYRSQGASISQLVSTQIAVGIGGGLVNVPTQLGVQASVSHSDVAAVTAIFLTILEIGGAVGNAISGASAYFRTLIAPFVLSFELQYMCQESLAQETCLTARHLPERENTDPEIVNSMDG